MGAGHEQIGLPFESLAGASAVPPPTPYPSGPPGRDAPAIFAGPAEPEPPDLILIRHPRARRYVLRVVEDGRVRVTIPRWGSKKEARAFAERERAWIERQRQRQEEDRERRRREREQRRQERVEQQGLQHVAVRGGEVDVDDHEARRAAARRELIARAKRELPARLLELAARCSLTVARISIRNQKWRWGSCSPSGHICLNWRLVQMPDAVRDYVLIHELMHLKRLDHSPRFWKLVAQACPDYRELRAQLRHLGRAAAFEDAD